MLVSLKQLETSAPCLTVCKCLYASTSGKHHSLVLVRRSASTYDGQDSQDVDVLDSHRTSAGTTRPSRSRQASEMRAAQSILTSVLLASFVPSPLIIAGIPLG